MMVEYIPRLIERKHCALLPLLCTAPCKRKISTTKNNRSWTSGTRIRGMVLDNFFSQLLLTCFFFVAIGFFKLDTSTQTFCHHDRSSWRGGRRPAVPAVRKCERRSSHAEPGKINPKTNPSLVTSMISIIGTL